MCVLVIFLVLPKFFCITFNGTILCKLQGYDDHGLASGWSSCNLSMTICICSGPIMIDPCGNIYSLYVVQFVGGDEATINTPLQIQTVVDVLNMECGWRCSDSRKDRLDSCLSMLKGGGQRWLHKGLWQGSGNIPHIFSILRVRFCTLLWIGTDVEAIH